MANSPLDDLPKDAPGFLQGDDWTFLLVVGGIAFIFIGYLVFDYFIMRHRTKRFLRKRPPS